MNKLFSTIFLLVISVALHAQDKPKYKRTEDIIYGRKFGTALTMDVLQPQKTNGVGVIMVVSGGWFSAKEAIAPDVYKPFLDRGYTVFAVVHGSQPKFQIPEIIQDMHRAVRYIRHHAVKYGVDPNRLGVTGGSAGGHLSLVLGTRGTKGSADAKDPIDRESSAVQCVACFFPPTDFLNYGEPGVNATGVGTLQNFKPAFGSAADTEEGRQKLGREISPIYFVHSNQPPMFILHGDADKLVPIQQAEAFVQASEKVGAKTKLVVKKGEAHGWKDWPLDFALFADWFDEHLRGLNRKE